VLPLKNESVHGFGLLRRLVLVCGLIGATLLADASPGAAKSAQTTQDILAQYGNGAYGTTVAYVADFYPLWFTYNQFQYSGPFGATNAFVGAQQVTPLYHFCVAINDDTLYTSVYFDLRAEPVIVTIPETTLKYTTLTLDPYGTTMTPGLPTTPGVYAFTGPKFSGSLPAGVTQIQMPINFPSLYIRTVKYSPTRESLIDQGMAFQKSLLAQPLSRYLSNPTGGRRHYPSRN
jgi:hypothetical protein